MRALVIEDEALVAFLLEDMLEAMGYTEIHVAATEAEAINLARAFAPDLVTSDARLLAGCGIDAALAICSERPVPVVFVTGNATRVRERIREPVIVEKPFAPADLALAISRARASPGLQPASTST